MFGAPFSWLGTATQALSYTLVALSLVILTGWVGQISLAQASFVGIGAFLTGVLVRDGLVFPLTLPVVGLITASIAALLGLVALRVRGLYLAVATLIFAWMTQIYLFAQPWLAGIGGIVVDPDEGARHPGHLPLPRLHRRDDVLLRDARRGRGGVAGAANLRRSKTGRAWLAVKGSEVAAASLGIPVMAYKLMAFAVAGFLAGVGGNLLMTHNQVASASSSCHRSRCCFSRSPSWGPRQPRRHGIGGHRLRSARPAVLQGLGLAGLLDIVSSLLLAVVLLAFPSGLAGLPPRLARAGASDRRRPGLPPRAPHRRCRRTADPRPARATPHRSRRPRVVRPIRGGRLPSPLSFDGRVGSRADDARDSHPTLSPRRWRPDALSTWTTSRRCSPSASGRRQQARLCPGNGDESRPTAAVRPGTDPRRP